MNLCSANYFYTMGFTFVIIKIMTSLVGFLKKFMVCITINEVKTFPICNYFPSFLYFFSFTFTFFLTMLQSQVLFSPLPNASAYL